MLIFIDESGDTGFKFKKGSSRYYILAAVLIKEDKILTCEEEIKKFKNLHNLPDTFEFHFKQNTDRIRQAFWKHIKTLPIEISFIIVDKEKITATDRKKFLIQTYQKLFFKLKTQLTNSTVINDTIGGKKFLQELTTSIKRACNNQTVRIKKVKQESAKKNSLLQVADYIAAIEHRKLKSKKL